MSLHRSQKPRTSPADTCCASQITWMTGHCSVGGQIFHQAIDGDFPGSCTKCLCPKHATLYLSKRYQDKCGVVDCLKQGTSFHSGVRWCREHAPSSENTTSPATRRHRSRSKARSQAEEQTAAEEAEDEPEDRDPDSGELRARSLLRASSETADPQRRVRRRPPQRSPGSTPKSNIQWNLARIEMLSSPASEVDPRLLR